MQLTGRRVSSAAFPYPPRSSDSAVHVISIDVDYPTECDDEYWQSHDPDQAFKQPPGKPSNVSFFNANLRLKSIQVFCLRTIVSVCV